MNGSCSIRCIGTGERLENFRGHLRAIADCCWSTDDKFVVTCSDDGLVLLWQASGATCLQAYRGHVSAVLCCCINALSTIIASGSIDETIRLWNVASGGCVAVIPAHADPVTGVQFARDGSFLVSSSYDGSCRLWDVHTCGCIRTLRRSGLSPITRLAFAPTSSSILLGTLDRRLLSSVSVFTSDVDELEYLDTTLHFTGCVGCSENCVFMVIGSRAGTCSAWESDANKNSFKEIKLMTRDNQESAELCETCLADCTADGINIVLCDQKSIFLYKRRACPQ